MNTGIRAVLLGAGRMGRRHLQAARDLNCHIVGVADPNNDALEITQKEQSLAPALLFTDPLRMLEQTRPECVIVATTAPSHGILTCAAAEVGAKYVLCEKPMATSLADCDRMMDVCHRMGTRLAINHQMRFMEQYCEPKRILIEAGGFTGVQVCAGNMGAVMNGTHYFEMMRFMSGEPIAEVAAWFSGERVPNPRGPDFFDQAGSIRAITNSGRRFYLECSADQGHGVTTTFAARYGQVFVDELAGLMYATVRESSHRELPTTRYGMPATNTIRAIPAPDMVVLSRRVLQALLSGEDYPSGSDGRAAVAAAVAAYISNEESHRMVRMDDTLPRERNFPWA